MRPAISTQTLLVFLCLQINAEMVPKWLLRASHADLLTLHSLLLLLLLLLLNCSAVKPTKLCSSVKTEHQDSTALFHNGKKNVTILT
jgi:hypothetical protein